MNTPVPETQPTEQPPQPSTPPNTPVDQVKAIKKPTKLPIILMVIITLIALAISVYLGYQNYLLKQQISQSPTASPSPTDSVPNPTATSELINGWTKFTHPVVGYEMEYPANWTGGLNDIPEAIEQDYQDFYIESPNHQISEGYPVLESGAEFFIRVEKTQYLTTEEIFNNDPLAPEIAFDKIATTVDGLEAIQYDYSYEGHRATMTIFTKNDNYYIVKYRYVDNQSRQTNWDDYIKLLSSFKIK